MMDGSVPRLHKLDYEGHGSVVDARNVPAQQNPLGIPIGEFGIAFVHLKIRFSVLAGSLRQEVRLPTIYELPGCEPSRLAP